MTETEYDERLKAAELGSGPDSSEVAAVLLEYANFLKQNKTRLLDAANMQARATVIRASIPSEPEQPSIPKTEKKCVFCAEVIQFDAVKCRYCGSDLSVEQDPTFWDQHGWKLFQQKNYEAALEATKQYMRLKPNIKSTPDDYCTRIRNIVRSLEMAGRVNEAENTYKELMTFLKSLDQRQAFIDDEITRYAGFLQRTGQAELADKILSERKMFKRELAKKNYVDPRVTIIVFAAVPVVIIIFAYILNHNIHGNEPRNHGINSPTPSDYAAAEANIDRLEGEGAITASQAQHARDLLFYRATGAAGQQ